nr:MAG TPA: hypothetical protein [Caudoviricetes sp.]
MSNILLSLGLLDGNSLFVAHCLIKRKRVTLYN